MMKIDRALQEVWDWKDQIYRQNKGKKMNALVKFIHEEAESFKRENHLKFKQKKMLHPTK